MDASLNLEGRHPFCFRLDSAVIIIVNILGNRLGEGLKGGTILFKSIHIWISPVRCPRRMQSSISSQKTPKYKKLSRKRKTAQNLSISSCLQCRWWGSNPHVLLAQGILSPPRLPFRHTGACFWTTFIIPDSMGKIKRKFCTFFKSSRLTQNT